MNTVEESWGELDGETFPPIRFGMDYLFESIAAATTPPRRFGDELFESIASETPMYEEGIENESNISFLIRIRREMDEQRREFMEEERRSIENMLDIEPKRYIHVFPNGWVNGAGPRPYENISKPIRPMTNEEKRKAHNLRMNFR
jgi:hypothetical protein